MTWNDHEHKKVKHFPQWTSELTPVKIAHCLYLYTTNQPSIYITSTIKQISDSKTFQKQKKLFLPVLIPLEHFYLVKFQLQWKPFVILLQHILTQNANLQSHQKMGFPAKKKTENHDVTLKNVQSALDYVS